MSKVDYDGLESDVYDLTASFQAMATTTADMVLFNKQKMIGKLIISMFVMSIIYIGININFLIKKDLCQGNQSCISTQESLMLSALTIALSVMSVVIVYSYVKFYKHFNKMLSNLLRPLNFIPLIVYLVAIVGYMLYLIISQKLNIAGKLFILFKYIFTGKFREARNHWNDPVTNKTLKYYLFLWFMVIMTVVSIISKKGIYRVPLGYIIWFTAMMVLVLMWIPAIDYIFGVVDINDDQKASELFSSGWHILYPITFLVCFYFMSIILFHLLFIGMFSKYF